MSTAVLISQISIDPAGPPAWLDQQELQQVLRQDLPNFLQIENISTRSEQFSQRALRVQVQAKHADKSFRTLNYLVKSEEQSMEAVKFPSRHNFQLELHMYNVVLPALTELYQNVGQTRQFSPTAAKVGNPTKKSGCLYLEYLQAKGFRLIHQANGLNKIAMEAVLSKLAAYHAATARYLQLHQSQINQLANLAQSSTLTDATQKLMSRLQLKFHESLRANDLRAYEDKVKSFQKYIAENTDKPDLKKSFNVITIGACWPNNILGQIDAFGHIKDVVFIDFGSVNYGPAIYDLFQVLLTAPAAKTERFDGYVKYYHDQLIADLRLLKFSGKLPTLTDLQLDLLNYGHWGFRAASEILPLVLTDFESEDVEDIFKSTKYSKEIYNILPWLENRAYFEE